MAPAPRRKFIGITLRRFTDQFQPTFCDPKPSGTVVFVRGLLRPLLGFSSSAANRGIFVHLQTIRFERCRSNTRRPEMLVGKSSRLTVRYV